MLNDKLDAVHSFQEHESVVEDVCWNRVDENMFGSVSDDQTLKIWDIREDEVQFTVAAHTAEILSLDFSPFNPNLLITSSVDKNVTLWDMRNLKSSCHIFKSHKDEVGVVKFNPHYETLFASGSSDRRVMIWDVSKTNDELTEEELKDGPPELLFLHGGHTSKISDLDWNLNEKLMIASVAEDNIVQVWHMAREIFFKECPDIADKEDKPQDMDVDQPQ